MEVHWVELDDWTKRSRKKQFSQPVKEVDADWLKFVEQVKLRHGLDLSSILGNWLIFPVGSR